MKKRRLLLWADQHPADLALRQENKQRSIILARVFVYQAENAKKTKTQKKVFYFIRRTLKKN